MLTNLAFMYKGHKINIEYKYAPFLDTLRVHFTKKNQCPLDFISALPKLPKLETLILQFSGPVQVRKISAPRFAWAYLDNVYMLNSTSFFLDSLQVSRALRHTFRFANLKMIVFFLVKSWKECICSLAYLLKSAPSLEYFGVHVCCALVISTNFALITSQQLFTCLSFLSC